MNAINHRDAAAQLLADVNEADAPSEARVLTQAAIAHALLGLLEIQLNQGAKSYQRLQQRREMKMSLDLDRITHPLRLARGSHQPGSGKGCAMNVISYINGDTKITDFPECSARPLAVMVQLLNDHLAGPDGFLSPENSVIVLDLGWQTVGTAGTPREVIWHWLSGLLVDLDPEWGVVKYATVAIRRIAALCVRAANGDAPTVTEWWEAHADADAAAAAAAYAYAAAYAAVYVYVAADADARVAFTRHAIARWRELAGLDQPGEIEAAAVDSALDKIGV